MFKDKIWAITSDGYDDVIKSYADFMADHELVKEAASWAPETTGDAKPYAVKDGVAVIPIKGPVTNTESFFSFLYGGAAAPVISRMIDEAEADRDVKSILFDVDSPGGTVAGVDDLSSKLKAIKKPTVAYSGGRMLSAAMWLASAADKIVVSKTAEVGSIGVVLTHTDVSKYETDAGIKSTVITAGKYKAVGNPHEPLSDESRAELQSSVDYIYTLFVDTIAKNKVISTDKAMSMADGRRFVGQQAVDIGLVDAVGSYDTALNDAAAMGGSRVTYYLQTGNLPERTKAMSIESAKELRDAFPDLAAALVQEGAASVDVTAAVKAEADRIMGLAAVQFGDAGDKFKALVDSGVSVDQLKAIKAMEPAASAAPVPQNSGAMEGMLGAIHAASAVDPGQDDSPDDGAPKTFMAAWKLIKDEDKCDTRTAMSKASRVYPGLYDKHARGGK